MDYESVISSLFYLIESTKYLTPRHQDRVWAQVKDILEEAYDETRIVPFKLFLETINNFPHTRTHSLKKDLQKTSLKVSIQKPLDPQNLPQYLMAYSQGDRDYKFSEALNCMGGEVVFVVSYWDYYKKLHLQLLFKKCNRYSKAEFDTVMAKIRNLGFNS